MAERGYWNRGARRGGGDRRPIQIVRLSTGLTMYPDEDFMLKLIAYSDAKKAVYECECEQGHCEHVAVMLGAAQDIADRLVADPASERPTPESVRRNQLASEIRESLNAGPARSGQSASVSEKASER